MTNQFYEGQIVGLKSFGPKMTVREVDGENVTCVWFDKEETLHTETFNAGLLKPLDNKIETTSMIGPNGKPRKFFVHDELKEPKFKIGDPVISKVDGSPMYVVAVVGTAIVECAWLKDSRVQTMLFTTGAIEISPKEWSVPFDYIAREIAAVEINKQNRAKQFINKVDKISEVLTEALEIVRADEKLLSEQKQLEEIETTDLSGSEISHIAKLPLGSFKIVVARSLVESLRWGFRSDAAEQKQENNQL